MIQLNARNAILLRFERRSTRKLAALTEEQSDRRETHWIMRFATSISEQTYS
jgi:hypothetical protein